jgi:hypothetical protein
MKNLKRLGAALVLTFVLGLSAFAGEVETPPCAPPDPGILDTPPCAAVPLSPGNSTAPGQLETPPASNTADILAVVDAAMNLLLFF